jgi:hypothetical protein
VGDRAARKGPLQDLDRPVMADDVVKGHDLTHRPPDTEKDHSSSADYTDFTDSKTRIKPFLKDLIGVICEICG